MREEASPKKLLSQRFTSFEELAALVVAWDLDFRQVSENHSANAIEQTLVGDILFSHLECGCTSTHTGATPKNMYTISLLDAGCPDFQYQDHLIDRPVMLVSPAGQEFNLIVKPGYAISTFSISIPIFEAYCETYLNSPVDKVLQIQDGVVSINQRMATKLRQLIGTLSSMPWREADSTAQPISVQSVESQLLDSLFSTLQHKEPPNQEPGAVARNRILKRALEYIGDCGPAPLSVRDLAAAVNTSERTLERVFNRTFGISPKKYLVGQRIYAAHRQLWHANATETKVADIANAWGFWHMGQFAKDYRRFFAESPSETLNR